MSEQNLLNYNIFKHNSFNGSNALPFTFDYAITTEQRKMASNYTCNSSLFLPPINAQTTEQWKHKVSQSAAITITEKVQHVTTPSILQQQTMDTPTHIVSPEAIREALQEEKEEAMGKSDRRPFSQFSSFNALKQRRYSTKLAPLKEDKASLLKTSKEMMMTLDSSNQEKLKRPPNAYLLFNRDMRRKLLSSCPKMTVAEISKEVGDGWKSLPDEQKEYYINEASLLKQEHLKKHPGFIYTRRSKAQLAEDKKTAKSAKRSKPEQVVFSLKTTAKKRLKNQETNNGQRDPRGRKKKRQKHPFAPKHPMSAYLHYLASVYPKVSSKFPGSTVGPISKSISKTWHAMSPEERLPWTHKADEDKARYAREMQIYNNIQQAIPSHHSDDDGSSKKSFEEDVDMETVVNTLYYE